MPAPIFVIGHKNPDSDSICAVIGYTALLHQEGGTEAVASRQGPVRRETAYILERFGAHSPLLVTDVRPRVADAMTRDVRCVSPMTSLYHVGRELEEHDLRVLVVADDDAHLLGVAGIADLAGAFIEVSEAELSGVPLHIENILETLGGQVLVEAAGRALRDKVMVGAMSTASMRSYLEPDILLVIGDRTEAQHAAVEAGIAGLVITGNRPVAPELLDLARARNVWVLTSPHDTYATLRLIELSAPVQYVMRRDVATCGPDDLVDEIRERLQIGARSLIVVDAENRVEGIISRTNLLRPSRSRVALIDHNERGQAPDGVEEAEVVAVIDHHRVADFWTRTPPYMRLEPVGATSTIVAKLFHEAQLPLDPSTAGVLLGGILADTLLFRGPTTTEEDRRVARDLARIAGVDLEEFGTAILDLASDVSERTAQELLMADFKDFNVEGCEFGIGTIETTRAAAVLARQDELLTAMEHLRRRGYDSVLFAIIDIAGERSTILIEGKAPAAAAAFDTVLIGEHLIELPRIMSRKKDIVPLLGAICAGT